MPVKSVKMGLSSHVSFLMIAYRNKTLAIGLIFASLTVHTPELHAYLDPSTGSMIVSALVGIFASIALALKTYWYKLKNVFRRPRKTESGDDPRAND